MSRCVCSGIAESAALGSASISSTVSGRGGASAAAAAGAETFRFGAPPPSRGGSARDDDDDDDAHSDAHVIAAVEKVRSISHWSPYDRVGVANADP